MSIELEISEDFTQGCGVCRYGLVCVGRYAYTCICHRGKAKEGKGWTSIRTLLSDEDLQRYWPGGAPAVDRGRVEQLLIDGRVPPKFLPWSLQSYAERFRDWPQGRYVPIAEAWLLQPLEARSDLVLFGPNGTGKTGMAIALARGVAEQQQPIIFWPLRELAIAWRDRFSRREDDADDQESEQLLLTALTEAPLLVIDEVAGLSRFVEDTLTLIVDKRQRNLRPTILTLNSAAQQADADDAAVLAELLGATLQDRLRERAQFWAMKGQSQRRTFRGAGVNA